MCRHYVDKLCQYTTGVSHAASLCKRTTFRHRRAASHWSDSVIHLAHALTDVANWPRVQAATQVTLTVHNSGRKRLVNLWPMRTRNETSAMVAFCLAKVCLRRSMSLQMTLTFAGAVTSRSTLRRLRPGLLPGLAARVSGVPAPRALVSRTLQRPPIAMATAVAASYTAGRAPAVRS